MQLEETCISLLCEQHRLEELLQQRTARADEVTRAGAVRTALLVAERLPGTGAATLATLRDRSRKLTARLNELEEELEGLRSSRGEALEARQRVGVAARRSAALAEALRLRPAMDAERRWQVPNREQAALGEESRVAALALDTAAEAEGWDSVREMVEALMDHTEDARRALVVIERACDAQTAAQRTASAEAAAAAKGRSEPLRVELQSLQAQTQALRRSLSDDERRRLEAGARARQEESKLRKEVGSMREDVDR